MRILITGAAGMVGRKLTARLLRDGILNGASITSLDLHDIVAPEAPAKTAITITAHQGDLAAVGAAEKLVADGYVARDKIVAEGGSAGGMLMGAIANMRPDLWVGVLAEVPFADVLNTMSEETLPLTPPE